MNTSDILNRAADYLQQSGWRQGGYGKDGGPRCLIGALRSAAEVEADLFVHQQMNRVGEHLGTGRDGIHIWNDAAGRTQAEVIEVLRATALVEAARETQPAEVSL